jgi:NAD(P)-dependent dehydrogenase (short-subunit alcohol dehydrogenase family)
MPADPPDPTAQFRLDGKVALVTGGSRGLGREMVLAFARAGADVVVASRKADACLALAKQVERETGRRALAAPAHVGRWQECDDLAKRALDHFGSVHVLVNNAGMSPVYPSVEDISEELYDKVLGVNLKGPFRLSVLVGRAMADGEGGSIINVSSVAAVQPTPGEVPYGAAKAGLHNLTKSLARAFAPRVRVNCIMPGPFMTDISKAWPRQAIEALERNLPLRRGGRPDEIVGAALYFASDASRYATGSVLKVDGGAAFAMG